MWSIVWEGHPHWHSLLSENPHLCMFVAVLPTFVLALFKNQRSSLELSMDLKDLYVKVECPYNASHKIIPLRMPYHLHRCRKNHPNVTMAVCPYNATHEVKAPELKYHMTNCPNRTLLERDMPFNALQNAMFGKEDNAIKGNTELPCPARIPFSPDDDLENWDEDDSPVVFRPQVTARPSRRSLDRRQVDSQLRIPQRQSIAASFTSGPGEGAGQISGNRNNNIGSGRGDNSFARIQASQGEGSSLSPSSPASSLLSSSTMWQENANGHQQTTSPGFSFMAFGRGRARPALSPTATQSSMLLNGAHGLSAPAFIRMGRGCGIVRPTFRS